MHRRARALRKLANQLTEGTVVMSARVMQNYVMSYAMITLFDEKLLKVCSFCLFLSTYPSLLFVVCLKMQNDFVSQYELLITAAVELIGAICKQMFWSQYLYYLKKFIHILQNGLTEQKLAVRYTLCDCVLRWNVWLSFVITFADSLFL